MPRPDRWLRQYFADLLHTVLSVPSELVESLVAIYRALWRPLVDLLEPSPEDPFDGSFDEDEE